MAVLIQPACEQVMEQPSLDLLQLSDQSVGLPNRRVDGVKDLGDATLFGKGWQRNRKGLDLLTLDPLDYGSLCESLEKRREMQQLTI